MFQKFKTTKTCNRIKGGWREEKRKVREPQSETKRETFEAKFLLLSSCKVTFILKKMNIGIQFTNKTRERNTKSSLCGNALEH